MRGVGQHQYFFYQNRSLQERSCSLEWREVSNCPATTITFFKCFLPYFYPVDTNFLLTTTFRELLITPFFFIIVLPFSLRCAHGH